MASIPQMGDSFSIGRVFGRTFSQITSNLTTVGVFVLIVHVISVAINYFGAQQLAASVVLTTDASAAPNPMAVFQSPAYWVMAVAGMLVGLISFAGAVHGYLAGAGEAKASISDCFQVGLRKALPLFALEILWILAVYLGVILLIVPGLILMTMWSVAVPALIGENAGIFGSFGRSRTLTKSHRWAIFGTLLVFLIVMYVILGGFMFATMGSLVTGAAGGARPNPLAMMSTMTGAMLPFTFVIGLLFALVLPSMLASLFIELRSIKEGGRASGLRDIFA